MFLTSIHVTALSAHILPQKHGHGYKQHGGLVAVRYSKSQREVPAPASRNAPDESPTISGRGTSSIGVGSVSRALPSMQYLDALSNLDLQRLEALTDSNFSARLMTHGDESTMTPKLTDTVLTRGDMIAFLASLQSACPDLRVMVTVNEVGLHQVHVTALFTGTHNGPHGISVPHADGLGLPIIHPNGKPLHLPPLFMSLRFSPATGQCTSLLLHAPEGVGAVQLFTGLGGSDVHYNRQLLSRAYAELNGRLPSDMDSVLHPSCQVRFFTSDGEEDMTLSVDQWADVLEEARRSFPDLTLKGFTSGMDIQDGIFHSRAMLRGAHTGEPYVPPACSAGADLPACMPSKQLVKLNDVLVEFVIREGQVVQVSVLGGSPQDLHAAAMRMLMLYGDMCGEVRKQNLSCLTDSRRDEHMQMRGGAAAIATMDNDPAHRHLFEVDEDPEMIKRRKAAKMASLLSEMQMDEEGWHKKPQKKKVVCSKGDALFGDRRPANPLLCDFMTLDQASHQVRCKLDPEFGVCECMLDKSQKAGNRTPTPQPQPQQQ